MRSESRRSNPVLLSCIASLLALPDRNPLNIQFDLWLLRSVRDSQSRHLYNLIDRVPVDNFLPGKEVAQQSLNLLRNFQHQRQCNLQRLQSQS